MRTFFVSSIAIAIAFVFVATNAHAASIPIRAYVDAGYGKTDKLKDVVAEASTMLSKSTGTTLELVDAKPWKPSLAGSKALRPALAELQEVDAGKDAIDVAFIGAQAQAGADYHKLVMGKPLGRYAVVRAAADAHEEAALIVHALAHVLGSSDAMGAPTSIMSATYDKAQSTIDDDNATLIKLGATFATATTERDRASALAEIKREVTARKAKLDDKSATDVLNAIDELAGHASSDVTLSKEQASLFNDAVAALNKKDYVGAYKMIGPLADKPDASGQIIALACRIDGYDGVTDANAAKHCDRTLKETHDVFGAVAVVRYALHTGDAASIKRAFAEAGTRVASVKPGAATADVDELAMLALKTGHLSTADAAVAKSSSANAKEIQHEIDVTRMRAGLPRGLLPADSEAAVVDVVRDAGTEKELIDAMTKIDNALAKYGNVPGLLAEKCDLQRRKQKYRDAEETCRLAVEKYPDGSGAHMLAGMVYNEDDLAVKAMPYLEKALQLDPEFEQTWIMLDDVYHHLGKRDDRKKLQAQYQQRFQHELVPIGH